MLLGSQTLPNGTIAYGVICSGSLLADDGFLPATHCTLWREYGVPDANIFVSFDTDLQAAQPVQEGPGGPLVFPEHVVPITGLDRMPGFWLAPSGAFSRNDVAVVHLDESASEIWEGIGPIELPSAGFLTQAAGKGGLVGHSFANVGYGFQRFSFVNPTTPVEFGGLRMISTSPFAGLRKDHLLTQQNDRATGEGGICLADSGGPNFLKADPRATTGNLVVSLNVGIGYHDCGAGVSASQRLDPAEVLAFLAPWATKPRHTHDAEPPDDRRGLSP